MRLQLLSSLLFPLFAMAAQQEQEILTTPERQGPYTPLTTTMPSLADLLTIETSASIFYSYAREVELSQTFGDHSGNNTLLVPTNKAVMALSRKPYVSEFVRVSWVVRNVLFADAFFWIVDTKDPLLLIRGSLFRKKSSTHSRNGMLSVGCLRISSL